MLKKIFIPTILVILAYGFWVSPDFKEIAAGVSIFLFGMLFLEAGFKAFTGGILEQVLQRTTNTLPKSIGFGVISTTIMQSSSLVSVITISFISAGLITLAAGIGIIFGANIGTTTGAWLVAGVRAQGQDLGLCHAHARLRHRAYLPKIKSPEGHRIRAGWPGVSVSRHPPHEGGIRGVPGSDRSGEVRH